ncbi:MAG: DUF6711 family protein [bacterium]
MAKFGSFVKINGNLLPYPDRNHEITHTNFVDSGRNLNGTVFGEVIGRTQYKLTLSFPVLSTEEYHTILQMLEDFYFDVEFYDPLKNKRVTVEMYVGDRTAKPFWIDDNDNPTQYNGVAFNLVDRGVQ